MLVRVLKRCPRVRVVAVCGAVALSTGCTSLRQWCHNGFKVGPNFQEPAAPVAAGWIDGGNPRLVPVRPDPAWWNVFSDPVLNELVTAASRDNLDLKTAGTKVLEAQAQRNVAAGQLFPQSQEAFGSNLHAQIGPNANPRIGGFGTIGSVGGTTTDPGTTSTFINTTAVGFNASWEFDFWGRYRRSLESANASLEAARDGVADALVVLTAEVATGYVQLRTAQERMKFSRDNVEAQKGALKIAEARFTEGKSNGLDVAQAQANLAQTEATLPAIELALRQANNQLGVLLARPPGDLVPALGTAPIPTAPPTVALGIPAELLERRPDVRQALRQAAAQAAKIGVAEADFYPAVGVSGLIGYGATDIRRLVQGDSFISYVLPNFQWKILNYGRIANNVRFEEATLQENVLAYQKKVLTAGQEVENAVAAFLQYQIQVQALEKAVQASQKSVDLALVQYREGKTDFNQVFTLQSTLARQQDQLASAHGNVAASLIAIYRALGGGWQAFCPEKAPSTGDIRLDPAAAAPAPEAPKAGLGLRRNQDGSVPPPAVAPVGATATPPAPGPRANTSGTTPGVFRNKFDMP